MPDVTTPPAPMPLLRKLEELRRRHAEIDAELNDPAVFGNAQKLVALNKEKGAIDLAKPDESSWHSTILALLLLLHVTFPAPS